LPVLILADGSPVTLSSHVIGGAIQRAPDDVGSVQHWEGDGRVLVVRSRREEDP